MTKLRRFGPVVVAAMITAAAACGSSTDSGPQAASVTGVAGDSQTASTGATLPFPLSLVTLDANGHPAQGVHVTWSATPSGGATFAPATTTTDVNGVASTSATLGSVTGTITIHAAVSGLSDVLYHVTAVDPCTILTSYTFGDTVNAALSTSDCNYQNAGWFYDFYQLDLPAGQQSIRVSMHANFPGPSQAPADSNDTWIDFWSAAGPLVAFDDDSVLGGGLTDRGRNSQLDVILPGGSYVIGANSYNRFTTGAYTLSASARPGAFNGCRQVWVTRGVTVNDSLTTSDCADSSATPRYYDVARIQLVQGSVLTISVHSTAINPRLSLYQILEINTYTRSLVAQNDDSSAGNPNAFIKYTVPVNASGPYDILIGTSDTAAVKTGAYTFDVSASATTARPVARVSGRRAWLNGDVLGLPRPAKH
jgi:hypothetical protein